MPATVIRFDHPDLPGPLYLDTTFLIRFLSAPNAGDPGYARFMAEHNDCRMLADRITAQGIRTFVSDWVLEEFIFVRSRIDLERAARAANVHWKAWLEADPTRLRAIVEQSCQEFERLRLALGFTVVDLEIGQQAAVRIIAQQYMSRYSLLSRDAFHLAVCDVLGHRTIVSLDPEYVRADTFVLVTCSRGLVAGIP